jgi:hypothetical protein
LQRRCSTSRNFVPWRFSDVPRRRARAAVDLGEGDPYANLDLPRDEVKIAINIMLYARIGVPSSPSCRRGTGP